MNEWIISIFLVFINNNRFSIWQLTSSYINPFVFVLLLPWFNTVRLYYYPFCTNGDDGSYKVKRRRSSLINGTSDSLPWITCQKRSFCFNKYTVLLRVLLQGEIVNKLNNDSMVTPIIVYFSTVVSPLVTIIDGSDWESSKKEIAWGQRKRAKTIGSKDDNGHERNQRNHDVGVWFVQDSIHR